MPNKLTDTEVKKALECCSTYHDVSSCKNCPLDGKCEPNMLEQYALDLINRQEAELDKYEQIKITINEFWDILLKFSIIKRKEKPTLEEFAEAIQEIKAEAYKEFAEKIKEKTKWLFSSVSINNEVDNLLNELLVTIND